MDVGLARSILEFLLRHGVDDHLLKNVIRVIPFSDTDCRLKKSMLLWKIQSEIAKGSVSEHILELLERIEELEREEIGASEAMKRAYCAVAVECAVRFLGEGEDKEWEYLNAVRRIWKGKGRVSKIEMAKNVGLVSDELRVWKEEIELAFWESSNGERVKLKSREIDAMEAVRAYLEEAWAGMGPPSLEFAPGIEGDDINWEFLGLSKPLGEQAGKGAVPMLEWHGDSIVTNGKNGKQRGVKRKHVAEHSRRETRSSRVKTSIKEIDMRTSRKNHGPLPALEIDEVQKEPRTRPLEVQPAGHDYLPDALEFSERTRIPEAAQINDIVLDNQPPSRTSSLELKVVVEEPCSYTPPFSDNKIGIWVRENSNEEPSVEGQHTVDSKLPIPRVGKSVEAALMNEANLENGQPSHTSILELKAEPDIALPGPSVEENAKAVPIIEIALDNQEPTGVNCSKLDEVVDDLCSDAVQLPENKTVSLVRESMREEPSVNVLNMVDSRSASHCVRKTVGAVLVGEPSLDDPQLIETNCLEPKEGREAPLPDSLRLSEKSKSGMTRENKEQEVSVETQNRVESRLQSRCVEKAVEATTANESNLDGQQPIEINCLKQNAVMQNPLPDALHFSGEASSSMCRENTNPEAVKDGRNTSDLGAPSNCVRKTAAEATPGEEACLHCLHCKKQRNLPKPSLMERNSTCHIYEWEDSIDGSAEDLPRRENRPHLPSPKRTVVSPLRIYEESKKVGRRKARRWSTEEEDALRAGVEKYGVGNWKVILDTKRHIFEGRTAVDLKDKWRNMTRYSAV